MVVQANEKCKITTSTSEGLRRETFTFLDCYLNGAFLGYSKTSHDFEKNPQTHESYMSKIQSMTRLRASFNGALVILATDSISKIESLVDDMLAPLLLPMDCLKIVAEFL
jgi:hypothetical protein